MGQQICKSGGERKLLKVLIIKYYYILDTEGKGQHTKACGGWNTIVEFEAKQTVPSVLLARSQAKQPNQVQQFADTISAQKHTGGQAPPGNPASAP